MGTDPRNYECANDFMWKKTPANIEISGSDNITFENCQFAHLGAAGVNIDNGSHYCRIESSNFTDISAAAI